jgi:hypothetical protein
MPITYSLPEVAELSQSDLKIVVMLTYGTDSTISKYN